MSRQGDLDAAVARHGDAVLGLVGDVRSATDMRLAVETATRHFGRLDAAVACAGVMAAGGPAWDVADDAVDAVWSVNVLGVRRLLEAAVPTLLEGAAGGRFVAVASAGAAMGLRHLAAYVASKHAVVGLVRSAAVDLAESGVTVNAVSPGSTRTAMLAATARLYDLEGPEAFAAHQPLGRLLEPEEVAAAITWLCSEAASGVTGANLAVDGGMTVA
jgi:SDR family mycofactocin-dependent oxidoreductase